MSIRDELLALEDGQGFIDPYNVVDWADLNRDSEIASRLEWDDLPDARAYRAERVSVLIRVYHRDESSVE